MLRYYTWAVVEKALSFTPGGKALYRGVGRLVKRNTQGTGAQLATAFPTARKVKEVVAPGGSILDLGTGWFHHDAFLIYLSGEYEVVLFDVEDRARFNYVRNYLRYLLDNAGWVSSELDVPEDVTRHKLGELLELPDRRSIYARCNFVPCISSNPGDPFLPPQSIDCVVSNCVLVHVRPELLVLELAALRQMLKDDGVMYHHLGHDDHWAFHDSAMQWPSFNYLRYSDRTYRWLFETKLEYHNRLVKPEWADVFRQAGLRVLEHTTLVTDESIESVRNLPSIDRRYASYPVEDLAVIYSWVLLGKEIPA